MKEYRVKVSIRNNLILSAIEEAGYSGYGSLSRFCEINGIDQSQLSALISMRIFPIGREGEFHDTAKKLMEALGAAPSDLWTEKQLITRLNRNTGETFMDETAVQRILENHKEVMMLEDSSLETENKEISDVLFKVIGSLTSRETEVINRHIFGDESIEEIAKSMGVTRERVRQIHMKALRKMRHPVRRVPIMDALAMPVDEDDRKRSQLY